MGEIRRKEGPPAIGPQPPRRLLTAARQARKRRIDTVERVIGQLEAKLVERSREGMANRGFVIDSHDEPVLCRLGRAIKPETRDVRAASDTIIIGQRGLRDQGRDNGIRRRPSQLEQVDRLKLTVVDPSVAEIPLAGPARQYLASYRNGRRVFLFLIVGEKEELVSQDRTSNVPAVLMVPLPLLLQPLRIVEVAIGIQGLVLVNVIDAAVKSVGP